jgi:CDP-6-deoxy-D-xylo-4-hexulose-3-dehydrase
MKKIWYAPNQKESYGNEEINAVIQCLNDGWLAGYGKYTIEFERRVSELFGKKYGLFVNSGSSACLLALASLNLPEGSEVITPACTFSTTVAPIIQLKLKPIFTDVELNKYVPSVEQIFEKINENTKVIMVPNLVGNSPDWKLIKEKLINIDRTDIILIEDSADTIINNGYSDISTTSFYSSHIITACGSGGMVMFNNEKYFKSATMYRDWGRIGDNSENNSDRYQYDIDGIPYDYKFLYGVIGYNMKSSEVNAAFGLVQIDKLDNFINIRRKNFERYIENLSNTPNILLPDNKNTSNWLAIPLQTSKRLELLNYLEMNNIQTRLLFSGNITRHPAYREYLQEFTNADKIMKEGFLLGCHHAMTINDVDYICDKIKLFMSSFELPELAFIFPRHVRNPDHKDIWKECLKCIRTHYKTEPIIIIDDNSDPNLIEDLHENDKWVMNNVEIIQSEFKGAGELLPYYYYYIKRPSKKAIFINDSMFIQKPFDKDIINNLENINFLWDFDPHIQPFFTKYEQSFNMYHLIQTKLLMEFKEGDKLVEYYESYQWRGCFASTVIINIDYLDHLQNTYNFLKIINIINNRDLRQILERTVAILSSYDLKKNNIINHSLFGNIYNHPYTFKYSFEDYKNNKIDYPLIKCWNSR